MNNYIDSHNTMSAGDQVAGNRPRDGREIRGTVKTIEETIGGIMFHIESAGTITPCHSTTVMPRSIWEIPESKSAFVSGKCKTWINS